MAVNGQSCIWRDSTETLSSDKIEFNSGAVVNEQGRIIQTKFTISSSVAVNEMLEQ